jgi:ribosomal protein S10
MLKKNSLKIIINSYDSFDVNIFLNYILFFKYSKFLFKNIDVKIIRCPIKKKKLTLQRSPHVNKKSRVQLEIRHYKTIILIKLNPFFNNIDKKKILFDFFKHFNKNQKKTNISFEYCQIN